MSSGAIVPFTKKDGNIIIGITGSRCRMNKTFAKWYDFFMVPLEKGTFQTIRRNLLKKATGSVLEIGSGTGINFPYYQNADKVTAIEPNVHMIQKSMKRKEKSVVPIDILQDSAEGLPFDDHTFDTVLITLALCTIPDPVRAIKEVKRVCKLNGRVLLFEHIKMENPILAGLQEILTPYWMKICDGCCLDRDTVKMVKQNGFEIVDQTSYFKGLFVVLEAKQLSAME